MCASWSRTRRVLVSRMSHALQQKQKLKKNTENNECLWFFTYYLLYFVFHTLFVCLLHTALVFYFVLFFFFFATRTNNKRTNHSLRTSLHIWSGDIMERLRCAAAGVSPLFGCLVSCVVVVVVVVALFCFFCFGQMQAQQQGAERQSAYERFLLWVI